MNLSEDEQQIAAIRAEFCGMQKAKVKGQEHEKSKKEKQAEKRGKGKKGKQADKDKWAWKKVAPREGMKRGKQVSGKTYHWCVKHKLWTLHTPEECQLEKSATSEGTSKETKQDTNEGDTKPCEPSSISQIVVMRSLMTDSLAGARCYQSASVGHYFSYSMNFSQPYW